MTEPISDHDLLIIMQGDIKAIRARMDEHPPLRHIDKDGNCLAYHTLVEHDRTLSRWEPDIQKIDEHDTKIDQWTGALAAVAAASAFIGGLVGALAVKLGLK